MQPMMVTGTFGRMRYMQALGLDEDAVVARAQAGTNKAGQVDLWKAQVDATKSAPRAEDRRRDRAVRCLHHEGLLLHPAPGLHLTSRYNEVAASAHGYGPRGQV